MLRPRSGTGQFVVRDELHISPHVEMIEYTDGYGNLCHRLVLPIGVFNLESYLEIECPERIDVALGAEPTPIPALPEHILQFLLPSRYCESDKLVELAREVTAGANAGYGQADAVRQWIYNNMTYEYGTSDSSTSALDVIASKKGVCRDFAHIGIALCRALDIPARMATGYLHELEPMDMHAWFEAYVGGRWYSFDATQGQPKGGRILVAYGRDAADVAFATHFGLVMLNEMAVTVSA